MFERECTLYAFTHYYCHKLTDDLDDAQIATQSAAGINHPAWILGHLAIAIDYALQCVGERGICPPEWHKLFGPGSKPSTDRAAYPSKAEMLTVIDAGHARVSELARSADPERMAKRHTVPFEFLQQNLPTVGDLLAHLMTTHVAVHLGQLSAWRRLMGLPGVLLGERGT
jgi:hypothetical protein